MWIPKRKDSEDRAMPDPVIQDSMVLVPPGAFLMGSDWEPFYGTIISEAAYARPDEAPMRVVYLPGFWIDRYPVTNREYAQFVEATGRRPPRHWTGGSPPPSELDHPVVNISYEEAAAYAAWCGKRLPTEAEWEKAARGFDGRLYPWGDEFDLARCSPLQPQTGKVDLGEVPIPCLEPVGSHPDGASPYGVEDMAGNVWEWTADLYALYPGNPRKLRAAHARDRVIRGGSWREVYDRTPHLYFRCATRWHVPETYAANNIGFRCVRDLAPEEAVHYRYQVDLAKLEDYLRDLKQHRLQHVRSTARYAMIRDALFGAALFGGGTWLVKHPRAWALGFMLAVLGLATWTCVGINLWRYLSAGRRLRALMG